MQESLITAIENNDIEQLKELLETITDVEKANAVIYSAYLGKMEPLELLIESGAVLDRPDKEGHTALYWAKERDHQAMTHLLQQHGAREEHISATTMELLKTVGLKQADLTALGIRLEDVERSANPHFLGQCLRFLVSVSFIKTFMLWPFMQRGSIKLDQEGEQESKAGTQPSRPNKNKRERPSFSDVSENEDARLLSTHEFMDTEEESEPDDDIVIKDEADTADKNERRGQAFILEGEGEVESPLGKEKKHKRKTCSAPVFTSSALLFESEPILKTVAAINAFHETVDTLISSVWNAFLSSLIINGLINYALYPEERGKSDLLDAFGITGLRNFGCITSIKAIKDSFLCSSSSYKKGYEDVLSGSLSSYYIWPFIAGIPILFGVINAIRASWNMKALDKRDVKALIQQLKGYKPGFWADGLGWIFTAAIPDLFPPAAILFMLPQPAIKNSLEKIRQTIIWDGRLPAKDRQKLFNHLNKFAQQRSQFTQMKALSMLSDIVDGINFKSLAILKEEGVEDETIKTLTIIKTKALKELEFLANHYHLPDAPKSLFRPLFRYIYANYLMWNLGYPQQTILQPLFFAGKVLKLYYTLLFYKAIIGGIIEMINNYLKKKECLESGYEWTWFEHLDGSNCTVCGDLPIPYHDMFTVNDCVFAYMKRPDQSSFEALMNNIINRDDQTNAWGVRRSFNLSNVKFFGELTYILHPKEWVILFNALQHKMVNLKKFKTDIGITKEKNPNFTDINSAICAFGKFLEHSSIENLDFRPNTQNEIIGNEWMEVIAKVLPSTKIRNLRLTGIGYSVWGIKPFNISIINRFAHGLQKSIITNLELYVVNIGDDGMKAIASVIPNSNIIWLRLWDGFTFKGCPALAENLPFSRVQYLNLNLAKNNFDPDAVCAESIIKALTNMKQDFNLSLGLEEQTGNIVVNLFAKALSKSLLSPLKQLALRYDANIKSEVFFALLQALPKSQLIDFYMAFPSGLNYSLAIPQLADAMEQSKIIDFGMGLYFYNPSSTEIDMLIQLLPNKLRKITNLELKMDRLYSSPEQILDFFKVLADTHIQRLYLRNVAVQNLTSLAEILPQTHIEILILEGGQIAANGLSFLAKALNKSKVERLFLGNNNISDEGISSLFDSLQGSFIEYLYLGANHISDKGAKAIAKLLTTDKFKHGLWIDAINTAKQKMIERTNPSTKLISLNLSHNNIGEEGALALCNILSKTYISKNNLHLDWDKFNKNIFENCGVVSSAHSLYPMEPYVLLYRLYQETQKSFYSILNRYKKPFVDNSIQSELEYSEYTDSNNTTAELGSPADFTEQIVNVIDASHYAGGEKIIVDLSAHEAVAARGSIHSNNIIIGGDKTLLDVSQTCRINFLQAGKNNKLRLGFFSKNHVVVRENLETVQISGFDSKDTLHLISEHTVYTIGTNVTICQNEIIENDTSVAVIHLHGTTVQLLNTRCEDVGDNIEMNNHEAVYAAQVEVLDSAENQQSILYANLLSVCQTFLNSISKSVVFTAAPAFAAEILYRTGDYTRKETERFGEELQKLLILSFADSPHAIVASFLARWLATKLTNSPTIISTVGIGASIVTSVAGTILNADVRLGWMALQTGVALMGSVIGSYSVRWGLNKASEAKVYLHNKLNFWSHQPERGSRQAHNYDTTSTIVYR